MHSTVDYLEDLCSVLTDLSELLQNVPESGLCGVGEQGHILLRHLSYAVSLYERECTPVT